MAKLRDLAFTDLYVHMGEQGRSDVAARYAPEYNRVTPPKSGNLELPPEYEDDLRILRGVLGRYETEDFSIDFDGMRLRASRCVLSGSQEWIAMRRIPLEVPNLDDLGFKPEDLKQMRAWGDRPSGLIVIGGSTRAGKTTTAVALLKDYLITHRKTAYSIEDPVEFVLMGEHFTPGADPTTEEAGNFCFQHEVHKDEEWGNAVKTSLRWAPRYIFLGEVRTPSAAKWLLRAATSGHIVICTIHAGSVEETLGAILQSAQQELGDTARLLLADGLLAVVHQSIVNGRPTVTLLTTDRSNANNIRSNIRDGKLQILSTEIQTQAARRQQEPDKTRNIPSSPHLSTQRASYPTSSNRTTLPKHPWWKFW
jgi:twitching motility protein PilT